MSSTTLSRERGYREKSRLLGPFNMGWTPSSRSLCSAANLSADPSWAGRWQVCVCSSADAEWTRTQPTVLYGAVRWKWTADCFHLIIIRSVPPDGWGKDPHLSVFSWQDQMLAGVSGHLSTDIRHSIESNGWSNRVCLNNWQTDPIGPSVWKGP